MIMAGKITELNGKVNDLRLQMGLAIKI